MRGEERRGEEERSAKIRNSYDYSAGLFYGGSYLLFGGSSLVSRYMRCVFCLSRGFFRAAAAAALLHALLLRLNGAWFHFLLLAVKYVPLPMHCYCCWHVWLLSKRRNGSPLDIYVGECVREGVRTRV